MSPYGAAAGSPGDLPTVRSADRRPGASLVSTTLRAMSGPTARVAPASVALAADTRYGPTAVATGGVNGDGFVDLTAGVPFEVIGATVDAGAVKALYGSAGRSTGAES